MKKIVFVSLIILLPFLLGACIFPGQNKKNEDWKSDILMAKDCGEEGLMCCVDRDPVCSYGSCCVDPNDSERNYCAESCDFGKAEKFCRIGNDCDFGLSCYQGYCQECGELTQPCCAENNCLGDGVCFRGKCTECGLIGTPCCTEGLACQAKNSEQDERSECRSGLCQFCGADGHEPCREEPRCNDNHLLNNNSCYKCGQLNQPCCHELNLKENKKYCSEKDLECRLDFCSPREE